MTSGIDFGYSFNNSQKHPVNKGECIPELLTEWLELNYFDTPFLMELIKSRDRLGRMKYGQSLMTQDGRDSIQDAIEEFGDLLQYTYKAKMNGEDLGKIKALIPVLKRLCE